MRFAVIRFPGSNCDRDVEHVCREVMEVPTDMIWHEKRADLSRYDTVILPGGFSYGDYLRPGAIARFSPIMEDVEKFAAAGGQVLGICNGFQILMEAGLLPGAMMVNESLKFVCRTVTIEVTSTATALTGELAPGSELKIPVAHHEGNYYIDDKGLADLKENNQIIFRYLEGENPNGSAANIAGICSRDRNVLGLMPHPERAAEAVLGSEDGRRLFASLIDQLKRRESS
ncbi:phosphoribosylformylglycinamidine synthase subunit PurQ [Halarsenatibacter silvermanii]|uniref:Phosphoribosylformylglycinamidine synthase subunit PurQ n=1 Tax=Halarsenatibacter silvermanii TaxID=321763 RepID=A0A1G9HDX0_9FIRM|nr:phosphoribosylformylglycinamidine synthase subunit PurQ [Halarsenatibacter silvermanii]SDL11052.1 phosphoribosylformylglycinamidine synthase [Halarsenatibacter silvermanii]